MDERDLTETLRLLDVAERVIAGEMHVGTPRAATLALRGLRVMYLDCRGEENKAMADVREAERALRRARADLRRTVDAAKRLGSSEEWLASGNFPGVRTVVRGGAPGLVQQRGKGGAR